MTRIDDPFEHERLRRNDLIAREEQARMRALDAEEAPPGGKARRLSDQFSDNPFRIAALPDSRRAAAEERLRASVENAAKPVTLGGWEAGNASQEHQRLRFEIEADRALFLGKPVPTQPDLARMHRELDALHVAYQRSGDPSLLIGIADMKARYTQELKARGTGA
jgi:hypothetical protein